ncbi:MAG: hypothetical protein ACJ763_04395 [Bdellovibrionia bacterium]
MKTLSFSILSLLLSAQAMAATPIKTCTAEFKLEDGKAPYLLQAEVYKNNGSVIAKVSGMNDGKPVAPEEEKVKIQKFKVRPNLLKEMSSSSDTDAESAEDIESKYNEGEMLLFMASELKDAELSVVKSELSYDVNDVRSVTVYKFGDDDGTAIFEAYNKKGKSLGSYFMVMLSLAPCK